MMDWWSLNRILSNFKNLSQAEEILLKKAWNQARHLHAGQKRKSGQPYFIHPIAVASELAKKFADPVLTAAAFLHDTVEDCPKYTKKILYQEFGSEVGFLVDSVTKGQKKFYQHSHLFTDRLERLIWAGNQDIRCLLLKIADRQHNIDTISFLPSNKQMKMAFETQAVMIPMKNILGYDQPGLTISQATDNWHNFLNKEKLKDVSRIKDCLYQRQFVDLSGEMYNLAYTQSESIVWQITDKELFEKLLKDDKFSRSIEVISIIGSSKETLIEFKFNQVYINRDASVRLKISKFTS
ncbi:MAG TPA: HD domain-containing protein [bacterium]|nr:HD domain-containing protein [bacterium]